MQVGSSKRRVQASEQGGKPRQPGAARAGGQTSKVRRLGRGQVSDDEGQAGGGEGQQQGPMAMAAAWGSRGGGKLWGRWWEW